MWSKQIKSVCSLNNDDNDVKVAQLLDILRSFQIKYITGIRKLATEYEIAFVHVSPRYQMCGKGLGVKAKVICGMGYSYR